jgi:outer membrane protein W
LQLNAMVFFNSRGRFQPYLLGGIGFSSASVSNDSYETFSASGAATDRFASSRGSGRFGYVGLQAGIGADYRIGAHFALNMDIRGFVRGRTDSNGGYEFINSKGQATNTSGGGLISLGATYYF